MRKKLRRCPVCDMLHMHLERDMCYKCYNKLYVMPVAIAGSQKKWSKLREKNKVAKYDSLYTSFIKMKLRHEQSNLSLYKPWRNFWKFKDYIYKNGYVDNRTYIIRPNRKLGLSPVNIKIKVRNKENAEQ